MNDDSARWNHVNALLEQALDQPPDRREGFVRAACGEDAALAAEVFELLALESGDAGFRTRMRAALADLAQERGEDGSLVGMNVGPFVLTREIARGGMGQVFEARRRQADFEQTVAVKLLPGHRLDAEARARFAVERRVLAGLQHPNIAQLIDGGTLDDGMPYIVMEYVDGVSIDRYCREHGLSNEAIIDLVLQVCDAVQLAHRRLVVHRDIKPGNILVDANGTPKLLDFGIAKLLDADGAPAGEQTRAGLRLLTPAYASPEQLQGGDITTAVDVYALGLLTYVLLTRRLPYRADPADRPSLERQILSDPPEAPSDALLSRAVPADEDLPPDWSRQQRRALKGDLDTILLTALRKEPERRYANVAALAQDLRHHLAHRPIQARPDSLGYRAGLLLRRHPVAAPVSALALVMALGAAGVFTWLLAQERDRALVSESQALASEARALRTAEFAASLLSSTNAQQDADRLMSVSDLLEGADARIDNELGEEPRIALPMRLVLGEAYLSWGQYEPGLVQARAAVDLAQANGLARDEARALDLLSRINHDLGRLDEALDLATQSLEILRRVGTPADRALATNNLALSLNEAGRREEALPLFAEAEAALRALHGGDHPDIAWLLNNLGWCLHALGRYDEAMQRYDMALAMLDRLEDAPFDRALTLSNRSGLLFDLGRPEAAVRGWREALAILQAMFGEPGHAAVARGHNLLARGLLEQGRLDEALEQSRQAVAMNLALLGDGHRWTGYSLIQQAAVLVDRGELEAAEASVDAAAAIVEAQFGVEHHDYADVLLLRGRLALARGQYPLAERQLRAGRALLAERAAVERTPIDRVEWALAEALALQGQPEGRALAAAVRGRVAERLGEGDWRVRLLDASLALRPFDPAPAPESLRQAETVVRELSASIGSGAPRVEALARQLALSR